MTTKTTRSLRISRLAIWLAALGCATCLLLVPGRAEAGRQGVRARPAPARPFREGEPGGITGPGIQRAVRIDRWQRTKALAFSHMTARQRLRTQAALASRNPAVRARGVRNVLRNAYVGPF